MKLKYKLSILMAIIMAVIIGGLSYLSISQARGISTKLAIESISNAAESQSEYWKGRENRYILMLRSLAYAMGDFESTEVSQRRDTYDAMLLGLIKAESKLINVYTVWKPNAIDSMDAKLIGRIGSASNGQYAMAYSRESGEIRGRATIDIANSMAYFNGPDSRKDRVEEPFTRTLQTGENVILVRMMVPIINGRTKEIVGGIGMLLNISDIQEHVAEIMEEHPEFASLSIYSGKGFVLGCYRPERIGKMLVDVDKSNYGLDNQIVQKSVEDGKPYYTSQFVPEFGQIIHMYIHPIRIGLSDEHWSVMVGVREERVLGEVKSLTTFMIVLGFVSIFIAVLIIIFVLEAMTKPLIRVTKAIEEISEGDGDLTHSLEVHSNDEIGDLARHFNTLMKALRLPISETKHVVSGLASESDELSSVSHQLSSLSEETLHQVTTVASTTEQMAVNINAMASGAEEASVNANEVAGAAEEMSTNMNTIASAVEEMSASISEIASNAGEARNVAEEATKKSNDATSTMSKLGAAAKEIGAVTNVIKKIADKTNLLALNATIEAASAGEAGKGFAVVAGEIKELANQSAQSADDIAKRIEGIQSETNNAVTVINAVSEIIAKINESIETIAGHANQQTKATNEIANNVAQVNVGSKRVAGSIAEVAKGSHDIARNAAEAAKGATEVSHNVSFVSEAANASSHGATQVNSAAQELANMADTLRNVMSKFKV